MVAMSTRKKDYTQSDIDHTCGECVYWEATSDDCGECEFHEMVTDIDSPACREWSDNPLRSVSEYRGMFYPNNEDED